MGWFVGLVEGVVDGGNVGLNEGDLDGFEEGKRVCWYVGEVDGRLVGMDDNVAVGLHEGVWEGNCVRVDVGIIEGVLEYDGLLISWDEGTKEGMLDKVIVASWLGEMIGVLMGKVDANSVDSKGNMRFRIEPPSLLS